MTSTAKYTARAIRTVSFGDLADYYPADECTPSNITAWADSSQQWESALTDLESAVLASDSSSIDKALKDMSEIEMEWGDDPSTRRVRELLGRDNRYGVPMGMGMHLNVEKLK
jgi:hypothetical protein